MARRQYFGNSFRRDSLRRYPPSGCQHAPVFADLTHGKSAIVCIPSLHHTAPHPTMFVPQTAHFGPRTYSSNAPTTARRPKTLNNKENSHALPAKTPSRPGLGGKDALLLGADAGGAKGGGAATVGRARTGLGVKTVERNAGVQARPAGGGGAGTQEANGKGKGKDKGELGDEIGQPWLV